MQIEQRKACFLDKQGVLRIIDANSNRAREGARVVEDVSRFIIEDHGLALRWKNVRHRVSALSAKLGESPSEARNSEDDPGKKIDSEGEKSRPDFSAVALANAKRSQEAIRVLEEFSKISNPLLSRRFKDLRFEVYTLEKKTLSKLKKTES